MHAALLLALDWTLEACSRSGQVTKHCNCICALQAKMHFSHDFHILFHCWLVHVSVVKPIPKFWTQTGLSNKSASSFAFIHLNCSSCAITAKPWYKKQATQQYSFWKSGWRASLFRTDEVQMTHSNTFALRTNRYDSHTVRSVSTTWHFLGSFSSKN